MSEMESRLREAELAAGAMVTDARVVDVVSSTRSRARRIRVMRTASTVAVTVVAGVACGAVGWWALGDSRAPAATTEPTAAQHSSPAPSEGSGIAGLPTMVPVGPDLVAQYLDPKEGPALVTGAMPATSAYGDAARSCGEALEECDHPVVPRLTRAILDGADEKWAIALYSQAWTGMGPGSTGGGGGRGPAGLYLVGPDGQAAFVAAGDPAVGPIAHWSVNGLAWAPGRESAVIGGDLSPDAAGGASGFTLVNLLSGKTTTIFGECGAVQAIARDDGWLVRATCPGGAVAAVVSDAGELVTADGLLVADNGFAVNVDDSYLIAMHEGDGAASAYYALTPAGDAQLAGTDCYPTDLGRAVVCTENGATTVTEVSDGGVMISREDPALVGAISLEICTVGDVKVRRIGTDEPQYQSTLIAGDAGTPLTPDPVTVSQNLGCASAGGGVGYFFGGGGVWSFDSATLDTRSAIAAPTATFSATSDWPYQGVRVVGAGAVVGGPSFLSIG
ncbi:MAG: hypothetical protein HGA51_01475 [Demequinaceae bacterium]|nr:hypothetical protein [Demequinaceae bacterium]